MDTLENPLGRLISFETMDEKKAYGYFITAKEETDKVLLVFHEWWGLNDNIKRESDKLFEAMEGKAHVLAVDLYDYKKATDRERAGKLMQEASEERLRSIISGAFALAGTEAKFATIGWCFGGTWSLQASLMAGEQSKACIIYYGMPEQNVEKLATLEAPVLGIFASKDKWITPAIVDTFESQLKEMDKAVDIHQYNADHAFANPSNEKYDENMTEDAFGKVVEFLNQNFLAD
jgi:carboxymethylenebutenolidase